MLAVQRLQSFPAARLSLNVSGITATDPRWYGQLTEILSEQREINDRLTIEITETVALNDLNETARFIAALRELGCSVAIDDFGAGYTSFRNIKLLNIDIVKLDGSFCKDLSANEDNQYFVRSLIDLARKFELKTVAEWVETEEDADLLKSWGVDYMQGKLFGEATLESPWPRIDDSVTAFAAAGQGSEPSPNLSLERHSAPATSWSDEAPADDAALADDFAEAPADEEPVSAPRWSAAWKTTIVSPNGRSRIELHSRLKSSTAAAADVFELDLSRLRAAIAALDSKFGEADRDRQPDLRSGRAISARHCGLSSRRTAQARLPASLRDMMHEASYGFFRASSSSFRSISRS